MPSEQDQGFTLLEVMIALAILGMTITVLLGLRNWNLDTRIFSQNVTTATLLVQKKLAETELAIDGPPEFGVTTGEFEDDAPGFFWRQIVSSTPLTIDVREVKVRVFWGIRDVADISSSISTLNSGDDEDEDEDEDDGANGVEAVAYYLFK